MRQKIDAVVFDFGGILVDLDKDATLDAFLRLGFDASPYIGSYRQEGVFSALERGELTSEEFCAQVLDKCLPGTTAGQVKDAWNRMLVRIPEHRMECVRKVKGQCDVYLLSNTNSIHWEYALDGLFPKQPDLDDCLDAAYLSYEQCLQKPEEEIFMTLQAEQGLVPERILFIDDSEENCDVAQELGWQVFHSEKPDDWVEYLEGLFGWKK